MTSSKNHTNSTLVKYVHVAIVHVLYSSFSIYKHHYTEKDHSIEEDSLDSEIDSVTGSSLKENDPGGDRSLPSKHERKLLRQNQRLLGEVERLVGELHHTKQQVRIDMLL